MVERYSFDLGLEGEGVWPCKFGAWVGWNDYAALQSENERLKSVAGYTAADVATAAADGFRDGVRSVDLERFRAFLHQTLVCIEDWAHQELGYTGDLPETDGSIDHLGDEADRLLALIDAHKGE